MGRTTAMNPKDFYDVGVPIWLIVSLFLIYVVFSFLLKAFVGDYLKELAVNTFSPALGTSSKRQVQGIWRCTFSYFSEGERREATHLVVLNQIGFAVYGNTFAGDRPYNKISGRIQDRQYFTGTWKNSGENVAHGAFQVFIPTDGQKMVGRWVGFDRRNIVMDGEWVWSKVSQQTTETAIEEQKKNFERVSQPLCVG
jgi:hypothetical protein